MPTSMASTTGSCSPRRTRLPTSRRSATEERSIVLVEFLPAIGRGLATTIAIAVASILGCAAVSIVLGVARRSKLAPVKAGAGFFVELLRGASVLIYLFWVYYALPLVPGMPRLSPIAVSIVVLSLVGGAYGAEIFVSGLQAVSKGQAE